MYHVDSGGTLLDIARGLRGPVSAKRVVGHNTALPNGTFAPVAHGGVINWLQAPTAVRVKSGGHVNDTVAGTRARKVRVWGLNGLWMLASEEIELAGASASAVTETLFLRVFYVEVTEVGTYGSSNETAIVIENGTGGTDLINIFAGDSHSQFCFYTVPAGCSAYIRRQQTQVDSTKSAATRVMTRVNTLDPSVAPYGPAKVVGLRTATSGSPEDAFESMEPLGERTDFWIEGAGTAAGVECSAEINFFLVNGN